MGGCREEDMGCQTCVELVLLLPCHLMLLLMLLLLPRSCWHCNAAAGTLTWGQGSHSGTTRQWDRQQAGKCDNVMLWKFVLHLKATRNKLEFMVFVVKMCRWVCDLWSFDRAKFIFAVFPHLPSPSSTSAVNSCSECNLVFWVFPP